MLILKTGTINLIERKRCKNYRKIQISSKTKIDLYGKPMMPVLNQHLYAYIQNRYLQFNRKEEIQKLSQNSNTY